MMTPARLLATAATLFAASVPPGGAGASEPRFSCTFANSPLECGFVEHARSPGRAIIVTPGRDGPTAVQLTTLPGDRDVHGSGDAERNDLALPQALTGCHEGREQWWAHSLRFPRAYLPPAPDAAAQWGVVFNFHHTGATGQANFQVVVAGGRLALQGFGGRRVAVGTDHPGFYGVTLGPVETGVWYDFVYHVRWSSGHEGFFHAWLNGRRVLAHRGPTLYAGMGCYLKLANYHTPTGRSAAVIHDRVLAGAAAQAVAIAPMESIPGAGKD